ncbi:alpha/beta hydrolase fold domain-containing protein [Chloroflexota bacterium]
MHRLNLNLVIILILLTILTASCRVTSVPATTPIIAEPVEPVISDNVIIPIPVNVEPVKPAPPDIKEPVSPAYPEPEAPKLPVIPTTDFQTIKDIEYGNGDGIPLMLDMYIPETPIASPVPAVVFIHGGGWQSGDKYPGRINELASHGFFGVSINYRLSGVAQFPAAIEDSKCAIRWLRANSDKYNIDPDRIGVWGSSAGGHLSMLVGTADESAGLEGSGGWEGVSSRVQAVCSYFGPGDFVSWFEGADQLRNITAEFNFLGGTILEKPDVYKLASPFTHVTGDDPPLLMVHGSLDSVVPFSQSKIMHQAYKQSGLDVTLVEVTGASHGFKQVTDTPISPSHEEIARIVVDFFVKHLLDIVVE